jgi:hypothetical protein
MNPILEILDKIIESMTLHYYNYKNRFLSIIEIVYKQYPPCKKDKQ